MTNPMAMASADERRGISFRTLAWAGLIFAALACWGAWLAYVHLLRYRRCAVEHLPPAAELAARLDVEQVVLFEPLRRHLVPLIDRLPLPREGAARGAEWDRVSRLRQDAGLNLGLDLREVLVAILPGRRWVLVLGGLFPRELVPAIESELRGEGATGWRRDGQILEFAPTGAALGQAADGALLLASDRSLLESALPSSDRFRELGLEREGPGSAWFSGAFSSRWAAEGEGPQWFGAIESARFALRLTREIEVDARLEMRDESAAHTVAGLMAPREPSGADAERLGSSAGKLDPWGLLVRSSGVHLSENMVEFVSRWRQPELDRAARDFAAWLQRQLSVPASSPS